MKKRVDYQSLTAMQGRVEACSGEIIETYFGDWLGN